MKEDDKQTLIRYRIKQAYGALQDAVFLRANSDTTLGAVNRAYYAMFYAVLALLQQVGKIPRKHSGAIALFDSEFVRKEIFPKVLSNHLHQAFESRQDSDYHAIEPISLDDTDKLIQNAKVFVQTIDEYLKGIVDDQEDRDSL